MKLTIPFGGASASRLALAAVLSAIVLAHSQENSDPAYKNLNLPEVARTKHEVSYREVADAYGGPMSRAPVISVKAHPEVIWIRPDMGIGMIANPMAFATGTPPVDVPWEGVTRSLEYGYLPIVTSRSVQGPLRYEQLAYATLLDVSQVKTGHEKQVLMLRMSVMNTDPAQEHDALWWMFLPEELTTPSATTPFPQYRLFSDYTLFAVTGSLPPIPSEPSPQKDTMLLNGTTAVGLYEPGPGVIATRYGKALKFEMQLLPGQRKSVGLKVSSNRKGFDTGELGRIRKLDFDLELHRRERQLDSVLAQGMRISVPEQIVNRIYKAQILYNQTEMVRAADRDYYVPVQGFVGVWPWEQMKQLVALDQFGYFDEVRKSLGYFLKLQGKRPPNGMDVSSYTGVFSSSGTFEDSGWETDSDSTIYGQIANRLRGKETAFPNWVSNTGAALYAFAEHYFYSGDKQWLSSVAPALIKACDWIISERRKTRQLDEHGDKVLHYGLMPAGRSTDVGVPDYDPCFTDGYTYQGLQRAAEALRDIGNPEGPRLQREANSYREDILRVMRRTRRTDPSLSPYPIHLHRPDDWTVYATGPSALIDTELLDARSSVFPQLENYLFHHSNRGVLGLMGWTPSDDKDLRSTYYMVTGEDPIHYALLLRGEVEKALLVFYSALAFGVDKQTLGAVERFSLYDRRYSPFFLDSSGGMRICGMIRRTLVLENGPNLRLLAGAPRRWLEDGETIEVQAAPTYFGKLNMRIVSHVGSGRIEADLRLQRNRPELLQEIILRLPNPRRLSIRGVMVDGKVWKQFDPVREIVKLNANADRYHVVAQF